MREELKTDLKLAPKPLDFRKSYRYSGSMKTPMTDKLDAAVAVISLLLKVQGFPPTIREVAEALGIGSTTAYSRLITLRFMGRVTWADRHGRTLRIVQRPKGGAKP